MPKGEDNHGFRHSPAGADEIPGLIVLVPSEDNPTQDPYTPEEGDLLVGQTSPLGFARYPFDPADSSSTRNVLAGDQGDTKPTWKALYDGTAPEDVVAPTEAATPGTSLLAAHRDHGHSLTTAETDTTLRLAPDGAGGVAWAVTETSSGLSEYPITRLDDLSLEADGSTTVFALMDLADVDLAVSVFLNGLLQRLTTDYTVDAEGESITMVAAPLSGDSFQVQYSAQIAA